MIKVTIELWPAGDQERATTLAVMQIAQTDKGDDNVANYKVIADENASSLTNRPFATCTSVVNGHQRLSSVYGLIAKAARKAAANLDRKDERRRYVEEIRSKAVP